VTKTQTRRSVSLKGVTYERLRAHCAGVGRSISDLVEELIADHLKAAPAGLTPQAVEQTIARVVRREFIGERARARVK
jgi:hypothetical protein